MKHSLLFAVVLLAACADKPGTRDDSAEANTATTNSTAPVTNRGASVSPPPPGVEPAGPSTSLAPAATGPIIYRAVGNEPGWSLTIRRAAMDYVGDYGEVKISEPTPAGFRPAPGSYRSARLILTIAKGPCSDGMSDLIYRQTVTVRADGKTARGCGGGTVAPDRLAGTSWIVTAINGRATPGGPRYNVRFNADGLTAGFGCNAFQGSYSLNGDHLATGDLHATEMACGEPERTFERNGGAVLASNMRVERISGERIRLVSEAGEIDLRRAI